MSKPKKQTLVRMENPFAGDVPRAFAQNTKLEGRNSAVQRAESCDARSVVWLVGFVLLAVEGGWQRHAWPVKLKRCVDTVGLMPVANNVVRAALAHCVVNSQAGILHLCRIGRLGKQPAAIGAKNAVLTVGATTHNTVDLDREHPTLIPAHYNHAPGILVGRQRLHVVIGFHFNALKHRTLLAKTPLVLERTVTKDILSRKILAVKDCDIIEQREKLKKIYFKIQIFTYFVFVHFYCRLYMAGFFKCKNAFSLQQKSILYC